MNKWIVALLVGLAMLVLIAPGIIGHLAERGLNPGIETARDEDADFIVTTDRYNRGWFASEGRHRIELDRRPPLPALIVDTHIDHGLVPLGSLSPGLSRMVSTLHVEFEDGELLDFPGDIVTLISLNGTTQAQVNLQNVTLRRAGGVFDWQGARLDYAADRSGRMTALSGTIDSSSLSIEEELMTLGRIDIEVDWRHAAHGLPLGSLSLKSEGASAETGYFGSASFASLSIDASSEVRNGKIASGATIDLRGLTLLGTSLVGFDDNIEADLSGEIIVEGFEVKPLAEIYAAWREALKDQVARTALASLYPQHEDAMQRLLQGGGDIRVERFALVLPAGQVNADMHFSLPALHRGDVFSWPGLFLRLDAALTLTLTATLFEVLAEAQPGLRDAVASGYLVPEGDEYRINMAISKGRATVNGKPLTMPMPGS